MSHLMKKSEMTEEDIKVKYINPAIEKSGWDINKNVKFEYCFTDGKIIVGGNKTKRGERKKADYLLYYLPNIPIAVIEAKANNRSVGDGMQQAIEYANILDVPFAYSSNGDGFLEHDMEAGVERELKMDEFPSPQELWNRYKGIMKINEEQEKIITEPYYFNRGDKTPRYYQRIAINKTVEAIAKGQNRILIVMATGTGKTYTAFQIIHRLWQSKNKRKILYLADRNILIDQTMQQDFKPFAKYMTKIENKKLDSSYEIYMSLYQQLAGDENKEPFRDFKPDFFDLIIVDECHRGSAKEDSLWRKILEYFSSATQIGMTATPKETEDVSNISYFGNPVYIYSLRQGIEDGFLAPFKVLRVGLNKDLEGYRPTEGKKDIYGNEIEDRIYDIKDFDRNIIIDNRTEAVAKRITEFLKETDRFAKTIVFCVDIEHAERMRQALVNENSDMVREDSRYIMRITGDNEEGKKQLDYFIDVESKYPVIVTTSKLLTTGVDCKTCRLIVLDNNINSITEFKQIIGRGTRIQVEYNKEYFTIMDFRNASKHFADPEFDGEPIQVREIPEDKPFSEEGTGEEIDDFGDIDFEDIKNGYEIDGLDGVDREDRKYKYRVNDIEIKIINETVQYMGANGKLITENIIDYSKKNILGEYATLEHFINAWNKEKRKKAIIEELQNKGVLLEELRRNIEDDDIDDFDLICHIAYDKKPLTKRERARGVKESGYLSKYNGLAREVINALLDKYMDGGVENIEDIKILKNNPFNKFGDLAKITNLFGGKEGYIKAVKDLERQIYMA